MSGWDDLFSGLAELAVPQKDDIEKLAFFGTLNTYAGENIKAKAIFGRLQAALES